MSVEKKWVKYVRGCIYLQRHYPCLKGDFEIYPKYFRVPFTKQVYYGNTDILEWYLEKKFAFQIGRVLINDLSRNNKYAREFRKNWRKTYNNAKKIGNNIVWSLDIQKLNDDQLKELFLEWFNVSENFNGFNNATIDAVDEVLQERIRIELKKIVKDKTLFEEAWRILTTPTKTTYIQKRDLEALEIARRIRKNGKRNIIWKKYEKEIRNLVKKYWWSTLGWMADKKYLELEAKKEILHFLKDKMLEDKYWWFKNFSRVISESKRKNWKKSDAFGRIKKYPQSF